MKLKIDKYGGLKIERAGEFKPQSCPQTHGELPCGDWCPGFGEPVYSKSDKHLTLVELSICTKTFFMKLGDFTDERLMEHSITVFLE